MALAAPLLLRLGMRAGDPKERLADGEGTLELRDCRVRWEGLPEVGVLWPAVGAGGKEKTGWTDGKIVEVGSVSSVRPCSAVEDEGEVVSQDDTHAGSVLQLVVPYALEASGEKHADGCEHIEVEEGHAVGIWQGKFVEEASVGLDLGADGGDPEHVAELGERAIVFGV